MSKNAASLEELLMQHSPLASSIEIILCQEHESKSQALPASLQQYTVLTRLTLQGVGIDNIQNLKFLTNLTSLDLSANNVSQFPTELCDTLTNLKSANLSKNQLRELPNNFNNLKLEGLILNNNLFTELPVPLRQQPLAGSLKHLDLAHNPFASGVLEAEFVAQMENLEIFILNNANLKSVQGKWRIMNRLRFLNLSNNFLYFFPSAFYSCPSLELIDLSRNKFTSLVIIAGNFSEKGCTLDLSFNPLEAMNIIINTPYSLIFNHVPASCVKHIMGNLRSIEATHNELTQLPIAFQSSSNYEHLRKINLCNNKLESIDELLNCAEIEEIHCANNLISNVSPRFSYLAKLKVLDLRNNCMKSVPAALLNLKEKGIAKLDNNAWITPQESLSVNHFGSVLCDACNMNVCTSVTVEFREIEGASIPAHQLLCDTCGREISHEEQDEIAIFEEERHDELAASPEASLQSFYMFAYELMLTSPRLAQEPERGRGSYLHEGKQMPILTYAMLHNQMLHVDDFHVSDFQIQLRPMYALLVSPEEMKEIQELKDRVVNQFGLRHYNKKVSEDLIFFPSFKLLKRKHVLIPKMLSEFFSDLGINKHLFKETEILPLVTPTLAEACTSIREFLHKFKGQGTLQQALEKDESFKTNWEIMLEFNKKVANRYFYGSHTKTGAHTFKIQFVNVLSDCYNSLFDVPLVQLYQKRSITVMHPNYPLLRYYTKSQIPTLEEFVDEYLTDRIQPRKGGDLVIEFARTCPLDSTAKMCSKVMVSCWAYITKATQKTNFEELENQLGYHFQDYSLLVKALTHPSYAGAHQKMESSNQRLEFLGDAVLDFFNTNYSMTTMKAAKEGELTQFRASTVNNAYIGAITRKKLQSLSNLVLLQDPSMLIKNEKIWGDFFEAITAAIMMDSGRFAAMAFLERMFEWNLNGDFGEKHVDYPMGEHEKQMVEAVEKAIGVTFNNKSILLNAITHKSACKPYNYERLEFFGDSILKLVTSSYLYHVESGMEGNLTTRRMDIIPNENLERIHHELGIEKYIIHGGTSTFKAMIVEAIIAAIYIDQGGLHDYLILGSSIIRSTTNLSANIEDFVMPDVAGMFVYKKIIVPTLKKLSAEQGRTASDTPEAQNQSSSSKKRERIPAEENANKKQKTVHPQSPAASSSLIVSNRVEAPAPPAKQENAAEILESIKGNGSKPLRNLLQELITRLSKPVKSGVTSSGKIRMDLIGSTEIKQFVNRNGCHAQTCVIIDDKHNEVAISVGFGRSQKLSAVAAVSNALLFFIRSGITSLDNLAEAVKKYHTSLIEATKSNRAAGITKFSETLWQYSADNNKELHKICFCGELFIEKEEENQLAIHFEQFHKLQVAFLSHLMEKNLQVPTAASSLQVPSSSNEPANQT